METDLYKEMAPISFWLIRSKVKVTGVTYVYVKNLVLLITVRW